MKGSQALQPLFEFSGACAGCGETPYIKLVTQLFGDRMVVANATGCSSIYGGNLPTTPWTMNAEGRGPAWSNSLFEDNAEFGLGLRLGFEAQQQQARLLVERLAPRHRRRPRRRDPRRRPRDRAGHPRPARAHRPADRRARHRGRPDEHRTAALHLRPLAGALVSKGVWIIGGDGWAYDIGFGGLDHVLVVRPQRQHPRARHRGVLEHRRPGVEGDAPGAVAKFAAAGKSAGKKDLGAIARAYGNVYVAQIAIGANDMQTTKALLEADAWPGPSLVIAYSTCIAHGIDMSKSMTHKKDAVQSGYWPLYRFQPTEAEHGIPFKLDSQAAVDPGRRLHRHRSPLRRARPHPSRTGSRAGRVGAGRRRRALALLQPARHHGAHRPTQHAGRRHGGRRHASRRHGRNGLVTDLTTRYLGLGAALADRRLGRAADRRPRRRAAGSSTPARRRIVLPSLFEEEIVHEEVQLTLALEAGAEHFAEALDYFPRRVRPDDVAARPLPRPPRALRAAVDVPVIASLNATSPGGWIRYAGLLADAGADAIELNVYRRRRRPGPVGRPGRGGRHRPRHRRLRRGRHAGRREAVAVLLVARPPRPLVRRRRGRRAGLLQPLLPTRPRRRHARRDPAARAVVAVGAAPAAAVDRHPPPARAGPVAGRQLGVATGADVAKALLVGADVAMTTSALLRHGPEHVAQVEAELLAWATDHEYDSVAQLRGSVSHATSADPSAFERANYVRTLHSWVTPPALTPIAPSAG